MWGCPGFFYPNMEQDQANKNDHTQNYEQISCSDHGIQEAGQYDHEDYEWRKECINESHVYLAVPGFSKFIDHIHS